MLIGIDVRMIFDFPTGIGNYRKSLVSALLELDSENEYVLIGNEDSVFHPEKLDKNVANNVLSPRWKALYEEKSNVKFKSISSKPNHPLQHFTLPFELRRLDLDIFWTNPWGATLRIPGKYVLTIHDLIYHHFPEFGSWKSRLYERCLEGPIARNAEAVVTISDFVKEDIVNILGVSESRVYNLSESVSSEYCVIKDRSFIEKTLGKYELIPTSNGIEPFPYFVYLGNQRPHKNLVMLLKAFEDFKEKISSSDSVKLDDSITHSDREHVKLVIIGGVDAKGRSEDSLRIQRQLSKMKYKDDVLLLGKVFDNNEVAAIFNEALAMVHPSMHEGFGMTPLEAMRCGCPVISSNVTAMPEVVGDSGILVNPKDLREISDAMAEVFINKELRKDLKKKALKQSTLFSWEKTATMLLDVFRKVA